MYFVEWDGPLMEPRYVKPRVGVDVDGVLANLLGAMAPLLTEFAGRPITAVDMQAWDLDHLLPPGTANAFWTRVGAPGFLKDLEPYPGAVDGLRDLQKVADVYIVTSYLHSGPQWVHERDAWLLAHFDFPRKKVVHTHAKYTFRAFSLVDDKPENVELWDAEHAREHVFPVLWEQPYNARHNLRRGARTNNWSDMIGALLENWEYGT